MILLFLNLDMVPWNSAPGGFAYISQSKWVGIIAIKTRESKSFFKGRSLCPRVVES